MFPGDDVEEEQARVVLFNLVEGTYESGNASVYCNWELPTKTIWKKRQERFCSVKSTVL
jgi:hypothetical protein